MASVVKDKSFEGTTSDTKEPWAKASQSMDEYDTHIVLHLSKAMKNTTAASWWRRELKQGVLQEEYSTISE